MPQRVRWLCWHERVRWLENQTHFLPPAHRATLKTPDVWRFATSAFIPNQWRRKIQNLQLMFWGTPPADHLQFVLLKFRMKIRIMTGRAINIQVKVVRWSEVDIQRLTAKQDTALRDPHHYLTRQWCFLLLPVSDWEFCHFLHFLFHRFQEVVRVSLSQFCLHWTINQAHPCVETLTASAITALRV